MSLQLLFFCCLFVEAFFSACASEEYIDLVIRNDLKIIDESKQRNEQGFVHSLEKFKSLELPTQIYYQVYCPKCVHFFIEQFLPAVQKLATYLNIRTYPYGHAKTIEHNGTYEFKCPNGPEECYGNKLHACSMEVLKNRTQALLFNVCLMKERVNGHGSDDMAAAVCGVKQKLNATSIMICARSSLGDILLKYYGDETAKADIRSLPHVLIKGKISDGKNYMQDLCAAFTNPPPPCKE